MRFLDNHYKARGQWAARDSLFDFWVWYFNFSHKTELKQHLSLSVQPLSFVGQPSKSISMIEVMRVIPFMAQEWNKNTN